MYSAIHSPLSISHRGLRTRLPENSIPSFLAAIEAGAEGVELDVHASADDVLHVHHDPALILENGETVPLSSLESSRIAKIPLEGGIAIPTLDDALEAIGSRCAVFIEIKATGIENAVVRCLRRQKSNTDHHAVHSFDHRIVKRMTELMPSVRTGILQMSYLVDSCAAMRACGATDLWQHTEFVDASLVAGVGACGGRVIAWTSNSETEWESFTRIGVGGICTDRVDAYVEWRRARE